MSNVIQFIVKDISVYRKQCRFINRNVNITNEYGERDSYPCIVLYECETGIPLLYTGFEKYVSSLVLSEIRDGETLAKRAVGVCNFLNYLLYETQINSLHECTITIIREYLKFSRLKDKDSGDLYKHDTWVRYRGFLFDFLSDYYNVNKNLLPFKYNGDDLQTYVKINDNNKSRPFLMKKNARFNVKGPRTTHKKNRILVKGYLDLLVFEAKKYEPEIVLAIALQAFAGLREGEVVNMTCGKLKIIRKQFAMVSTIELDLLEPAEFFVNWEKKTKPGSIKKNRIQKVYDGFIAQIIELYDSHIQVMESKGYETGNDCPLFVNYQGNAMTVQSYSGRVKKLFYDYFLPALKLTCEKQNTWADNAAFIETYEKEYPGAHMFRHWFTMYLITNAKLSIAEVMRWRGDSSQESMNSYIHENSELIEIYRESSYTFQSQLLDDII
ncbi:MAG: hypothetical protein CVV02_04880 [Firmicutes bacterium HGW-Firmicutes-7]|nr:MAG: hypothetical protein CVV02_04880 [Firmicutes bacterium HGW-Firmicutes-7]